MANTLKYIGITTSANFGNMVSMALATPLLPFLPLLAKQILLNNLLSDLPMAAIATDHVDADQLARPTRWSIGDTRRFMIVFGLISSAFDLITFGLLALVLPYSGPLRPCSGCNPCRPRCSPPRWPSSPFTRRPRPRSFFYRQRSQR